MARRKIVLALLIIAALGMGMVSLAAATPWILSEDKPLQILGYDVYKFEGSGHYAIFYPMPNGSVKLLKTGKVGILPTFVKVPRNAWLKEYATTGNTLKAVPTPIAIFVNERGLGIASLRGSRVKLKELEIPKTARVTTASARPCPTGYIPEGYRYCIPKDPTSNWIKIIASKVVTDEISFLGFRVDNYVLKGIDFEMKLRLNDATYSHWTAGIDVGPITIFTTEFGDKFEGKELKLEYTTPAEIDPQGSAWSRYVNLDVKYVVAVYGVLAYDRYTGKYTEMPVTLTYPLEILTTGSYKIYESTDGTQRYVEFNPGSTLYVPSVTKDPHYLTIPQSMNSERIWVDHRGGRRLIVDEWITNGWYFSSESSFSVPLGPGAVEALEKAGVLSKYPSIGRVLNSLSLTIGFHKTSSQESELIYRLQATPNRDCYALRYYQNLNVAKDYNKVKVPLFLITMTDGKSPGICNPRTGLCATSTGMDKENS